MGNSGTKGINSRNINTNTTNIININSYNDGDVDDEAIEMK